MSSLKKKLFRKYIVRIDVGVVLFILMATGLLFFLSRSKNLASNTMPVPMINQSNGITYGVALGSSATTWSKSKMDKSFEQMKKLGITSIRFDISWSSLQPNDSKHYNWAPYDTLIHKAIHSGISSLVILDYTPVWARQKKCAETQMCPPKDNQQFADYAAAVVKRYESQGVNTYEIWNEQNSVQFWQPYPSPEAYQKLLHATAVTMRDQSKNITILTGGMSPAGDPSEAIAPRDYLKRLYDAGAKNDFDGIAFHPYTSPFIVGQSEATNWDLMDTGTDNLRSTMDAESDSAKKIWITEYGAATNGSGKGAIHQVTNTGYDHVSFELQAEMADTAVASAESKPWLASLYWYTLEDGQNISSDRENFFGLQDSLGNTKPAFISLQNALKSIKR